MIDLGDGRFMIADGDERRRFAESIAHTVKRNIPVIVAQALDSGWKWDPFAEDSIAVVVDPSGLEISITIRGSGEQIVRRVPISNWSIKCPNYP